MHSSANLIDHFIGPPRSVAFSLAWPRTLPELMSVRKLGSAIC
jgi:hypothetical protein